MRLNCGLSPETKRDLKKDREDKKFREAIQWHKWFAWYPVQIGDNDCRWLETVERRSEPKIGLSDKKYDFNNHHEYEIAKAKFNVINRCWVYRPINS